MSDDETVYVVARRGGGHGGRAHVHTSEDCDRLQRAHSYVEKDRSLVSDKEVCSFCTGDVDSAITEDPFETRNRLMDLDPEDVGLPPIGERTNGGDA